MFLLLAILISVKGFSVVRGFNPYSFERNLMGKDINCNAEDGYDPCFGRRCLGNGKCICDPGEVGYHCQIKLHYYRNGEFYGIMRGNEVELNVTWQVIGELLPNLYMFDQNMLLPPPFPKRAPCEGTLVYEYFNASQVFSPVDYENGESDVPKYSPSSRVYFDPIPPSCYGGDRTWRCGYRGREYEPTTNKVTLHLVDSQIQHGDYLYFMVNTHFLMYSMNYMALCRDQMYQPLYEYLVPIRVWDAERMGCDKKRGRRCSGHGTCESDGLCNCNSNYDGPDCSLGKGRRHQRG